MHRSCSGSRVGVLRVILPALTVGIGLVVGGSPAPAEGVIKLRAAVLTPEGSIYTDLLKSALGAVRTETGGRVDSVVYTGGVAGVETEIIEKVRGGELDLAGTSDIALSNLVPEMRVLNLPYFAQNHQEAAYLMEHLSDRVAERLEKQGLVLVGWGPLGPAYLFSKKPIQKSADLKGQRIWIYSDDVMGKLFAEEAGGVVPVVLPWGDVRAGLEDGRLDIIYSVPLGAIAFQWYQLTKFVLDSPVAMVGSCVVLSKAAWERLSPKDRGSMLDVFHRSRADFLRRASEDNTAALRGLRKYGVKFISPTEEALREFREISLRVRKRLVGESFSREFLERAEALLAEYRRRASE